MAENKPVVESIKIGTLDKQIEILEQLGLTKSEITNLIYDTQGQITAENTDTLDIIIQQFAKILEQDELKTIEELARTLLANQSEASVKYVLNHELIGKVIKHILESDNDDFDDKTIDEILQDTTLSKLIIDHDTLRNMMFNSSYFSGKVLTYGESYSYLLDNKEWVLDLFRKDSPIRASLYNPKHEVPWRYCLEQHAYVYYKLNGDVNTAIKLRVQPGQELIPFGGGLLRGTSNFEFKFGGTYDGGAGVTFANGYTYVLGKGKANTTNVFPVYTTNPEQPHPALDTNHVTNVILRANVYGDPYTLFFIAIPTTVPGDYGNYVIISPFKKSICSDLEFRY